MAQEAAGRETQEAFARNPQTVGKIAVERPQTGKEYLASLQDGREVFI